MKAKNPRENIRDSCATPEQIRAYYRAKYPDCSDPRHPGCERCGKSQPEAQRNWPIAEAKRKA